MLRLYALHDNDENLKRRGAFEITLNEVKDLNSKGYGIFMLVNEFNGNRQIKNCSKINFWIADIDEGTKEEMMSNIKSLILKPSIIVESKKGYHCYWRASNATLGNYGEIEKGLIKLLNADKHCTDVSRILRFPTAYHMKNPKEPFLIKVIEQNDKVYSEEKMLCVFQLPKPKAKPLTYDGEQKDFLDDTKWERIFKVSQISEGNRNATLVRYLLWMRDLRLSNNQIEFIITGLNNKLSDPLPEWEINQMLKSKGI